MIMFKLLWTIAVDFWMPGLVAFAAYLALREYQQRSTEEIQEKKQRQNDLMESSKLWSPEASVVSTFDEWRGRK